MKPTWAMYILVVLHGHTSDFRNMISFLIHLAKSLSRQHLVPGSP